MRKSDKARRPRWPWILLGIISLALIVPVIAVSLMFRPDNVTISEESIHDLSGADIEVTFTNSDGFAKSNWIDVYFSPSDKKQTFFDRFMSNKELVFRYDPEDDDPNDLPTIRQVGPHEVRLELPRVSSVMKQEHSWKHLTISYAIGHIDYP